MMDTPISRRSALRTGTLAAIAAGLLGTTKPAEAAPASPFAVASLVDMSALTAESLRLTKVCRATQTASLDASNELAEHLSPEQFHLVMEYIEGPFSEHNDAFRDLLQAEISRHIPGLAPALWVIFNHCMTQTYDTFGCCCVDEPAEPTDT